MSVAAAAPGYVLSLGRRAVSPEETLIVSVKPEGGTLVLELLEPETIESTFVFHEGGFLGALALRAWALAQAVAVGPESTEVVVPQMAPGTYTACVGTRSDLQAMLSGATGQDSARCAAGVLSPYGELRLRLKRS